MFSAAVERGRSVLQATMLCILLLREAAVSEARYCGHHNPQV